jgi:hypothetical protein
VLVAMSIGLFIVREIAYAHRGTVTVAPADVTATFTADSPRTVDALA